MASLKHEIEQQNPFSSLEEEALLNLVRTSDRIQRAAYRTIRGWGITPAQYNVLRILRGAHPNGLTCSAIGERMIAAEPDITRLLGRLKAARLIRQQRNDRDRRIVWTFIAPEGLHLLERMDATVNQAPVDLLGHMSAAELNELIRLLELARRPCPAASGDGKEASLVD
ncbi:MAG TPA: MarR family transcriptional regulator [Terracidiphilus sp.]|nr:MarR family transcriptional regulator [Terracidiphilus sp.]